MRLITGLISLIVGIAEAILTFRFLLRLLGANPATPFVHWLYDVSELVLAPFRGIFPSPFIQPGYVFEFATLFAIMAYAIFGYIVIAAIEYLASLGVQRRTVQVIEERKEIHN